MTEGLEQELADVSDALISEDERSSGLLLKTIYSHEVNTHLQIIMVTMIPQQVKVWLTVVGVED